MYTYRYEHLPQIPIYDAFEAEQRGLYEIKDSKWIAPRNAVSHGMFFGMNGDHTECYLSISATNSVDFKLYFASPMSFGYVMCELTRLLRIGSTPKDGEEIAYEDFFRDLPFRLIWDENTCGRKGPFDPRYYFIGNLLEDRFVYCGDLLWLGIDHKTSETDNDLWVIGTRIDNGSGSWKTGGKR